MSVLFLQLPRRGPRSNVFPMGYARGRPHTAPGALGISEVRRSRRSHTWTAGSSLHHDPQHHNISFIKVRKWPTERSRTCEVLDDTSMNDMPERDTVTMDKASSTSPPSSCPSGIEGITSKGRSASCAKNSGKQVPAVVELVSQMSLVERGLTEDGSGEQLSGASGIEHAGKTNQCITSCGDPDDLGFHVSGLLDEPSRHKINPDEKSTLTEKICDRDNETPDDNSAECKSLSDKKSPVDESRDLTDSSPRPPSSVPALWYISEHNVYQQSVIRLSSTLKAAKALNRNSGVSMNRKPKFAPHAKQKKSEWNLLKERDKIVV